MFMTNTISQKIDAYAQANLKAIKQEEAKMGKHLTKYDIAERIITCRRKEQNLYTKRFFGY